MKKVITLMVVAGLCGCAAKSRIVRPAGYTQLAPNSGPVCLLRSPLPTTVAYTTIAEIKSSKKTYGSVSELLPLIAADARSVGADAVINLNTGQRMGAFAWARPVGTGVAVKLSDAAAFNCLANGGELR